MSPEKLLATIRRELAAVADPSKAPAMQAYMKSAMPYHGVPTPISRPLFKRVFEEIDLPDAATWRELVLGLWRGAKFREERYAAIAITGDKRARAFQTTDALPLYEELIVTGAWWDYVDDIAGHRLGELLRAQPKAMRKCMLAWSRCDDLWKRRSSIICQLGFKTETDLELLYACIEPSIGSKEFFLRKAIGWALRQYAWTDPAEVVRYVAENEARLSGLSRREALKNVERRRKPGARGAPSRS
jgi:3-methyladenine DNA glycosylase AlkD